MKFEIYNESEKKEEPVEVMLEGSIYRGIDVVIKKGDKTSNKLFNIRPSECGLKTYV